MWSPKVAAAILAFVGLSNAWAPPSYGGFNLVWNDDFAGNGGTSPNTGNWNIITGNLNVNNELETYSSSTKNVQLSGGNTLQLVPWKDSSTFGGWTSGRLESKYTFTPQAGKVTRAEASIRMGSNAQANKQGIWPAFWMLGDVLRHGGSWPSCGEIDILEQVNGQPTGHGTLHCDVYPGGICNEGNGIGGPVNFNNPNDFHTWRVEIDRTSNNWQTETLTWSLDGTNFFQITGSRIGNQNVWNNIAHSPLFFILNVAVGGSWPGNPNSSTLDGYGAMMEVGYAEEVRQRLAYLDENWLQLSAGREGYLADEERRGLDRHAVQWGDMLCVVGHVNNVIYNRYAESGRVNWTRNLAQFSDPKYEQEWNDLMTPKGVGLILASIRTDYKFPMTFPDRVTVLHKLVTKPDYSSDRFYLEAVMYSEQHRRPAAKCFEDIVVYDYRAAKKAPLKPYMVDVMRATFDLQEQRKQEAERKVSELQAFVKEVEDSAGAA
ncbi:hypothetical protein MKX07_005075 [Trichoderma sp. CBMAI-0711]|nr:hypothetical protein MKX07_005075 [Trichoderma sp. CBMAI-0711]